MTSGVNVSSNGCCCFNMPGGWDRLRPLTHFQRVRFHHASVSVLTTFDRSDGSVVVLHELHGTFVSSLLRLRGFLSIICFDSTTKPQMKLTLEENWEFPRS